MSFAHLPNKHHLHIIQKLLLYLSSKISPKMQFENKPLSSLNYMNSCFILCFSHTIKMISCMILIKYSKHVPSLAHNTGNHDYFTQHLQGTTWEFSLFSPFESSRQHHFEVYKLLISFRSWHHPQNILFNWGHGSNHPQLQTMTLELHGSFICLVILHFFF